MKKTLMIFAFVAVPAFVAAAAFAQAPPPGMAQPDPEFQAVVQEWGAMTLSIQHVQDKINALNVARRTEQAKAAADTKALSDLREYAAKCGDAKGCFVPVPETHSEATPKP